MTPLLPLLLRSLFVLAACIAPSLAQQNAFTSNPYSNTSGVPVVWTLGQLVYISWSTVYPQTDIAFQAADASIAIFFGHQLTTGSLKWYVNVNNSASRSNTPDYYLIGRNSQQTSEIFISQVVKVVAPLPPQISTTSQSSSATVTSTLLTSTPSAAITTIVVTESAVADPSVTAAPSPTVTGAAPVTASAGTDQGISAGAKAGIGVGVGLVAILLLVFARQLWRRRRARAAQPAHPNAQHQPVTGDQDMAELGGVAKLGKPGKPQEMYVPYRPVELPNLPPGSAAAEPAELDAPVHGGENTRSLNQGGTTAAAATNR